MTAENAEIRRGLRPMCWAASCPANMLRAQTRVTGCLLGNAGFRRRREVFSMGEILLFDSNDPATLRPWLIDHVCRYWLARIHDPAGGFFENIDAVGSPIANQRRATLAQARLTYVFSHACLMNGATLRAGSPPRRPGVLVRMPRAAAAVRAASLWRNLDNTRRRLRLLSCCSLAVFRATCDAARSSCRRTGNRCRRGSPTRAAAFSRSFAPGRTQISCAAADPKLCSKRCSRCMSRPARKTGCAAPARWSICSSAGSSIPIPAR